MSLLSSPLILGQNGQLAQALRSLLPSAQFLNRTVADFTRPDQVASQLEKMQPSVVINAVAFTAVDQAESQRNEAFLVNAETPGQIAKVCDGNGIPLVHYSTDYVFSGEKAEPYTEEDMPRPLNVYGESKLEGERRIKEALGQYLILRTSWVYYEQGNNFLNKMLQLAQTKEKLSVVNDQVGAPTYALDLARMTIRMLEIIDKKKDFFSGIYHVTNQGEATWYQFAKKIFDLASHQHSLTLKLKELVPISTAEFPSAAKRPLNSRLSNQKLKAQFQIELPPWEQALAECMVIKYGK